MADKNRGIYGKFHIERTDGDPNGKHTNGCQYFVLDVAHDPLAIPALARYAQVARADGRTALADDLVAMISKARAAASPAVVPDDDAAGARGTA